MQKSFIITAGGIGKRMNADIPKQFLELEGKPILLHTLENLYAFDSEATFILTLPADWMNFWNDILKKHHCTIPHHVVAGGTERFHSIKNALDIATGDVIAIHDGVRPFVYIKRYIDFLMPYLKAKPSFRYYPSKKVYGK